MCNIVGQFVWRFCRKKKCLTSSLRKDNIFRSAKVFKDYGRRKFKVAILKLVGNQNSTGVKCPKVVEKEGLLVVDTHLNSRGPAGSTCTTKSCQSGLTLLREYHWMN